MLAELPEFRHALERDHYSVSLLYQVQMQLAKIKTK